MNAYAEGVFKSLVARNREQKKFHQAAREVLDSLDDVLKDPKYEDHAVLERLVEADRVIIFKVPWQDYQGRSYTNKGFRVQFNNAIGPYKGGLRFHPTVNLGVLKFLGFEQVIKNALTGQPIGGAKGGSDFDPKGRSDNEIMRFCQSFMERLAPYIGPDKDIPAGDIGVGGKEIGWLFGQYKLTKGEVTGALTGKGVNWGGSFIRPEATGYGAVYFCKKMLSDIMQETLDGKTVVVSGSGNVAQFTVEKVNELGGRVVTLSDSNGCVYDPDGINAEKLAFVAELKNVRKGRIKEYAEEFGVQYVDGGTPWKLPCYAAFPSAIENELGAKGARRLVDNGCKIVTEGANMPCTPKAVKVFQEGGVLYGPGKAANAGGVAVSALEMAQNAQHTKWSREEVDGRLQDIMSHIYTSSSKAALDHGHKKDNILIGANIAGFKIVADAMIDQGYV